MTDPLKFDTLAVRAGTARTEFGEHSEALFLTSSFVFESAAQAAERFQAQGEGFVYSRFSNPTVAMFQDRLAALEGAEACRATASGNKKGEAGASPENFLLADYLAACTTFSSRSLTSVAPLPMRLRR